MSMLLTCSRGHQWESPSRRGESTDLFLLCPVCGEVVEADAPQAQPVLATTDHASAEATPAAATKRCKW
jgi:hypothetical protein